MLILRILCPLAFGLVALVPVLAEAQSAMSKEFVSQHCDAYISRGYFQTEAECIKAHRENKREWCEYALEYQKKEGSSPDGRIFKSVGECMKTN
jgi:hypothetical protein